MRIRGKIPKIKNCLWKVENDDCFWSIMQGLPATAALKDQANTYGEIV
jgi:hypothetical protein